MTSSEEIEKAVRRLITGGVLANAAVAQGLRLRVVDLQVLNLLALEGGRMTPTSLAMAMRLPRSSVTRLVGRLVDAGFVHRVQSATDGRSKVVEVDGPRLNEVTLMYSDQRASVRAALNRFTEEERSVVLDFLSALTSP